MTTRLDGEEGSTRTDIRTVADSDDAQSFFDWLISWFVGEKPKSKQEGDPRVGSIADTGARANNHLSDPPVKRECKHDFCVPRDWRLARKTSEGGWIIQRVKIETSWFDEYGRPHHDVAYYYEAWYVPQNSDRPTMRMTKGAPPYPNDSIAFDLKPGTKGDVTFTASARFYEGLSLDGSRFKPGNAEDYAGEIHATVPTATPERIELRNPNGSIVRSTRPVDRTWTYSWGW